MIGTEGEGLSAASIAIGAAISPPPIAICAVAHEERLEDRPSETEAQHIFERDLRKSCQAKQARQDCAGKNADAVARDTMHG
jgi:hypothetical protein